MSLWKIRGSMEKDAAPFGVLYHMPKISVNRAGDASHPMDLISIKDKDIWPP